MSTTNGDGTSLAPLGATPRSRPPSIAPTGYIGGSYQQHSYNYASPPYYRGENGLSFQGSLCNSFGYPVVSNPREWVPIQAYESYLGPCGYIEFPVERVPIHSNIFDGSYPPVAFLEHRAAASSTSLPPRTAYQDHQPFTPSSGILSTWDRVQYSQTSASNQNSFGYSDHVVLDDSYGGNSQPTSYPANQTHVSLDGQFELTRLLESFGPHVSFSSANDSNILIDDSPREHCTDPSQYSQDRDLPNVHPQVVDQAPCLAEPTPSACVDPPDHATTSASISRCHPTRCQPNLVHAPQHLRKALELLLSFVQDPQFLQDNEMEPTVDQAGPQLLKVKSQTGVSLGKDARGRDSIYSLFADRGSNKVWLCGHTQGNPSRAVGHIRSILNHRPFPCFGRSGGCASRRCAKPGMTVSFFTQALRDDHMKRSARKDECPQEGCRKRIRKGGMARHLKTHTSASAPSH